MAGIPLPWQIAITLSVLAGIVVLLAVLDWASRRDDRRSSGQPCSPSNDTPAAQQPW